MITVSLQRMVHPMVLRVVPGHRGRLQRGRRAHRQLLRQVVRQRVRVADAAVGVAAADDAVLLLHQADVVAAVDQILLLVLRVVLRLAQLRNRGVGPARRAAGPRVGQAVHVGHAGVLRRVVQAVHRA